MTVRAEKPITGRKVALIFIGAFSVIITVNLILAFNAVSTFPGLEVRNSYVASQGFDADRAAQVALDWEVGATVEGGALTLTIVKEGKAVAPEIQSAVFGAATSVAQDQFPAFRFDGKAHVATITPPGDGNWNLRLVAKAKDGTIFKQRIIVDVVK